MSTTVIDAGPIGPDESGGQYRNRVLTDRAVWWDSIGARQGIRRGGDLSTVAGQMAMEMTDFLAFVEERDSAGSTGGTGRGYAVWTDDTVVASFDVASASDRMDALVVAFADTSVGTAAFGTEVNSAGGQVVVVPGTSGVTTPVTDSDINDAIGSGGWVRLADVLVESTDTEINPANVTENDDASALAAYCRIESGTAQTIPGGSVTGVNFGTVISQNRSGFNVTTTSLDIPEDGYYTIHAGVNWDPGNNSGIRYVAILGGGPAGGTLASDAYTAFQGPNANELQAVAYAGHFTTGQTITVEAFQSSGGAVDAPAGSYLDVRQLRG